MPQSQLPVHTHFIYFFFLLFFQKKKEQKRERERERVSETTAGLHIGGMIAFFISHL